MYFGVKKHFTSRYLSVQTKIKLYKTLLRPVVTCGSENKALTKIQGNRFRILRKIFGPMCENDKWCIKYNDEYYEAYGDMDIIKVIKTSRISWLCHLYRERRSLIHAAK